MCLDSIEFAYKLYSGKLLSLHPVWECNVLPHLSAGYLFPSWRCWIRCWLIAALKSSPLKRSEYQRECHDVLTLFRPKPKRWSLTLPSVLSKSPVLCGPAGSLQGGDQEVQGCSEAPLRYSRVSLPPPHTWSTVAGEGKGPHMLTVLLCSAPGTVGWSSSRGRWGRGFCSICWYFSAILSLW